MARGFGSTFGSGTSNKITTTYTTSISTTRSYAIWVYRNGDGGNAVGRIWDKRVAGGQVDLFFHDSPNSAYTYAVGRSVTEGQWKVVRPSTGGWNHYVITYDSSSTTNDPVIYVNGSVPTITELQTPNGTLSTNTDAYVLGNRGNDNARVWDGMLAEFAIWDGAILTAGEAGALAHGLSPLAIRPQSLVEYVPMVRDNISRKNGAPTLSGTAVQPHPKIYLPRARKIYSPRPAASAPPASTIWSRARADYESNFRGRGI